MKGISRIDAPKCHGWLARVYRETKEYPKLFSDLKYGGKGKALLLAKKYIKTMERKLPPSRRMIPPPFILSGKTISTNQTGHNGISLVHERQGRKKEFIGYAVSGNVEGRPTNKRFLISTFGSKRETLKAAITYRKKLERIMLREYKARLVKSAKVIAKPRRRTKA
jgi:hypothetical protein